MRITGLTGGWRRLAIAAVPTLLALASTDALAKKTIIDFGLDNTPPTNNANGEAWTILDNIFGKSMELNNIIEKDLSQFRSIKSFFSVSDEVSHFCKMINNYQNRVKTIRSRRELHNEIH
jgi:hypothetical protein